MISDTNTSEVWPGEVVGMKHNRWHKTLSLVIVSRQCMRTKSDDMMKVVSCLPPELPGPHSTAAELEIRGDI